MIRYRLYKLSICFFAAIFLVFAIYAYTTLLKEKQNGFIRLLPPHKISGVISKNINYNSWYIGGSNDSTIYLGNNILPGRVATVDTALKNYKETSLTGFDTVTIHKGAYIQVDSPRFYLMDGVKPLILRADVKGLHLRERFKATYFTGGIPLTPNSVALRSVYEGTGAVLVKGDLVSGAIKKTKLLQKQIDGIFCTDGELVKVPGNTKNTKMVYVYYYRNQFLCVDSNLKLLYKGKTIDTISRAQIKVAKIAAKQETTMAAPPLYVNKRASANSNYLFVQSDLQADNETDYMIKDVSMIDVYAIADGKYQFSFYLPDFRGFKVRDFKVYGQSLYALYDQYLYKYKLNF